MEQAGVEAFLTPPLLELLGDAVTVISADRRYVYVSEGAAPTVGQPAAELVGAEVWQRSPRRRGPRHGAVQRAMRERTRERVLWYTASDATRQVGGDWFDVVSLDGGAV